MQLSVDAEILGRTRVLVISNNKAFVERSERYLSLIGVSRVYTAKNALLGLRLLQDRQINIGCVLWWAPKGLEFLAGLRTGRWGSALKKQRFVLYLPARDTEAIRKADALSVNGVVVGLPDRELFAYSFKRATQSQDPYLPLKMFRGAHVYYRGAELLFVPLPDGFETLTAKYKCELERALTNAASQMNIRCPLVMTWRCRDGLIYCKAGSELPRVVDGLSLEFINSNLNRRLLIDLDQKFRGKDAPVNEVVDAQHNDNEGWIDLGRREAKTIVPHVKRRTSNVNLKSTDIACVIKAFKEMGRKKYFDKYCFSQNIISITPNTTLSHVAREYFTSLKELASDCFPDVDISKIVSREPELFHILDSIFLQSFFLSAEQKEDVTINLRVHTLGTPLFESFLRRVVPTRLMIEITQADIVNNFEQFLKARKRLSPLGVKFGVDNISPDAVGLLNLDLTGVQMAKISWSRELKEYVERQPNLLDRFTDNGIQVVLARVDEPEAIKFGNTHGINQFQGFFVDGLNPAL